MSVPVQRPNSPVLVVEDDAEVRDTMVTLLEHEGYRAVGAANGQEAFALIRSGIRPCLILLDLGMPVMDGREFRATQLRDEKLAIIPVVVFSARPDAEEIATSISAVAALKKPVRFEHLRRLLREHCLPDETVRIGPTIH
jgi:CheY-like chemotaxis protein